METHIGDKCERSLRLARALLDEISRLNLETYLLHQCPADDLRDVGALLCRLAHGLGMTHDDLLRLRDNLSWFWSQPGHSDTEHDNACSMRFLKLVLDAMCRRWVPVIDGQGPPAPPQGVN
jgi:hypothetical protein